MKKILTSVALTSALFVSGAMAADEAELTKAVVKLIKQYNDLELKVSGKQGGSSNEERYFKKMQFEIDQLKEEIISLKARQNTLNQNQVDLKSLANSASKTSDSENIFSSKCSGTCSVSSKENAKAPVAKTEAEIAKPKTVAKKPAKPAAAKKNPKPAPKKTAAPKPAAKATEEAAVYVIPDSAACGTGTCSADDTNADKIIGDFLKAK